MAPTHVSTASAGVSAGVAATGAVAAASADAGMAVAFAVGVVAAAAVAVAPPSAARQSLATLRAMRRDVEGTLGIAAATPLEVAVAVAGAGVAAVRGEAFFRSTLLHDDSGDAVCALGEGWLHTRRLGTAHVAVRPNSIPRLRKIVIFTPVGDKRCPRRASGVAVKLPEGSCGRATDSTSQANSANS